MSMPEPTVNSSGRRKKEFTFILVSHCGTCSFGVFIAMLYVMPLIPDGFAPLLPSSVPFNQGLGLFKWQNPFTSGVPIEHFHLLWVFVFIPSNSSDLRDQWESVSAAPKTEYLFIVKPFQNRDTEAEPILCFSDKTVG